MKITGNLALVKSGTGTFTPSGTNTFTGGVTLNDGILGIGSAVGSIFALIVFAAAAAAGAGSWAVHNRNAILNRILAKENPA